jgi:hypothetical protein
LFDFPISTIEKPGPKCARDDEIKVAVLFWYFSSTIENQNSQEWVLNPGAVFFRDVETPVRSSSGQMCGSGIREGDSTPKLAIPLCRYYGI